MYIKHLKIENIRGIKTFDMDFPKPAGWHVLIGDNGSGKTSIMRSISLALIDVNQRDAARQSFEDWLSKDATIGTIKLDIYRDKKYDAEEERSHFFEPLYSYISIQNYPKANLKLLQGEKHNSVLSYSYFGNSENDVSKYKGNRGWFSVGYGPFRRFAGGNPEDEKLFKSYPQLGAHLSMFGEDVALTEILKWLKDLDYLRLKEKESQNGQDNTIVYENLIKFINKSQFLPHKMTIEGMDTEGVIFKDGNGNRMSVVQLSDGYRSILSLTFELIRQLVRVYGAKEVFKDIAQDKMCITLPGVVLIDEIDAHLHPTWQTRIGEWFTKYFPELQFIVTTHSPLICRACENGSIWRLAAPGSQEESGEIAGEDKQRLVYGNIMDAYGTEVFGQNIGRSEHGQELLEELSRLETKETVGTITTTEIKRLEQLRKMNITHDLPEF
jgi:predicted ATP-binding protein involved in virulence